MRLTVKLFLLLSLLAGPAFVGHEIRAEAAPAKEVVVYYFYGTGRCATCHKLEGYAKEALDTYFKKELAAGQIVFRPVNIDQPENEHFVQDYQLFSKSVVLSLVKDGKEVKSQNLTKIWQLVGNKQKYLEYVKSELEAFMKG